MCVVCVYACASVGAFMFDDCDHTCMHILCVFGTTNTTQVFINPYFRHS